MGRPVVAISLDAADPSCIARWISEGILPTLARLRREGAQGPLRSYDSLRAESPWPTFLTGAPPEKVGYWAPVKLRPGSYALESVGAYDLVEYPPFYALGGGHRIAAFDVPQIQPSDDVHGVQVLAWGAHSPLTASLSRPEGLLQELIDRHGEHPVLGRDYAAVHDLADLRRLQHDLETGIARRAAICRDLLGREAWDLFLTAFGAFHSAGHALWHLSDPAHPLHPVLAPRYGSDPLRQIYAAADRALGEVIDAAPPDAHLVVFSPHGMVCNTSDLPSMVFLPELLFRLSFPGRAAIAPGRPGTPPGGMVLGRRIAREGWARVLWSMTRESSPLKSALKKRLPDRLFRRLEPWFGEPSESDPDAPLRLFDRGQVACFEPAVWFQRFWPRMKAFALPSTAEGHIRINLQDREPEGIVPPSAYDGLCDEIIRMLERVTDARTGAPLVKEVLRTRRSAADRDPRLPDPDLVVLWRQEAPADVADSPDLGRVGPVPFFRSGGHGEEGLLLVRGPGVEPGSSLPPGRLVDVGPTILRLMDAPIPGRLAGKPLVG
jgi:predicted AlkP superfamily phosphohydrolase/phosphomutase